MFNHITFIGNSTIEKKIASMKAENQYTNDCYPWASWLPKIMFSMNVEWHKTIKKSPYVVVFGQYPPSTACGEAIRAMQEEDEHQLAKKGQDEHLSFAAFSCTETNIISKDTIKMVSKQIEQLPPEIKVEDLFSTKSNAPCTLHMQVD